MPLVPAFQLRLNNAILPNLATVDDGKRPSLTCGTTGGKAFVHSPHSQQGEEEGGELRFLNVNQKITAIASAPAIVGGRDCALIGTSTSLLLYDVQENSDVFFRDVDDGVNAIVVGRLGATDESPVIAVVGGQCNIQGFDLHSGEEVFWTVTGDNVTSLAIWDVNGDGKPELLVGSEDCMIRVFSGDSVIAEITEADVVTGICPLHGTYFCYSLANGTVGMYDGTHRVWRVKSRNAPLCIFPFDLDDDGVPEVAIGWSNGRLEIRSEKGDLVYRDQFPTAVVALSSGDYRMDGKVDLIACSADGEVRGYIPTKPGAHGSLIDKNVVEETLAALSQRKQQLQFELRHYEDIIKGGSEGGEEEEEGQEKEQPPPPTEKQPSKEPTELIYALQMIPDQKGIQLTLKSPPGLLIHGVYAIGEQTFTQGSLFVHPKEPVQTITITLEPPKNQPEDISVRAFLGPLGSNEFLEAEIVVKLPKFAMFAQVPDAKVEQAAGKVSFTLTERAARVSMWLKQSFTLSSPVSDTALNVAFLSLRDSRPLRITMSDTTVAIMTDDMDLAGDIIQDICDALKITELDTTASFPADMEAFKKIVSSVGEYNQVRLRFTAEMADSSNLVKTLLVKAEDSRMLSDMRSMKQAYTTLYEIDRELIGEFKKRENNQAALMKALKDMNQAIQRAARLRFGNAKSKIIAASRDAILSNSISSLFKILRH